MFDSSGRSARRLALALIAVVTTLLTSPAAGQGPPERARAEMLADTTAITPGGTFTLAIRFTIDDGWHMYAPCQNDTGIAPIIDLKVPAGFEVGAPQWPVPTRYVSGNGQLLDHIYEDEFVILVPMRAPEELPPDGGIEFAADMEWLVCKEVCVPGWGEAKTSVPVGRAAEPANKALFNEARKLVPRDLPQDDQWRAGGVPMHLDFEAGELVLRTVPGRRVVFHPFEKSARPADRFEGVVADDGTLRIRFADPENPEQRVVRGVVEIVNRNRVTGELGRRLAAYVIETALPAKR